MVTLPLEEAITEKHDFAESANTERSSSMKQTLFTMVRTPFEDSFNIYTDLIAGH